MHPFTLQKFQEKKRKHWIKPVYLVDAESLFILAQIIDSGPSSDKRDYFPLIEKAHRYLLIFITLLDKGFDGVFNPFGLPYAVVPCIRRGGAVKSLERNIQDLMYLMLKWFFIYGQRWMSETVNSVIKRKFGSEIKEKKEESQTKSAMLLAVVYNVDLLAVIFLFFLLHHYLFNRAILNHF